MGEATSGEVGGGGLPGPRLLLRLLGSGTFLLRAGRTCCGRGSRLTRTGKIRTWCGGHSVSTRQRLGRQGTEVGFLADCFYHSG